MTRLELRIAIVGALVLGASVAIFLGLVTRDSAAAPCTGCRYSVGTTNHGYAFGALPATIYVAKVSIPKGTSGNAIGDKQLSFKSIPRSQFVTGMTIDPRQVRGEVAIRTIPAGATITAADFALRGPIYYPSRYPKRVPASDLPAWITNSRWLPDNPSDFAVAPGVWVDGSSSESTLDTHVANGTLIGYCAPIQAFQAHNPDVPFASKCWRS